MISILIITKGRNSVNINLCTSSSYGLHLYQVPGNILNGFRDMERTRFQY